MKGPAVLVRRADVRLALAAGLTNAFVTFTGLPYGYYATLAVLAVTTGTFGTAVGLGRQRVLGSILGAAVLVAFYEGLGHMPFPLAIALALGLQRLLGGLLKLQVGYKVGGLIIVMGWLVHHSQLALWVPMRLLWTEFGVLVGAWSLALLWPTTALSTTWEGWADVLEQLAAELRRASAVLVTADPQDAPGTTSRSTSSRSTSSRSTVAIRNRMMAIRAQRAALLDELGGPGSSHPALPLLGQIDDCCSRLVGVLDGLERRHPHHPMGELSPIRRGEAALLLQLAAQLEQWVGCLRRHDSRPRQLLPPAPPPLQLPAGWLEAEAQLADAEVNRTALERLRRVAGRLQLLRQAVEAMERTERLWQGVRNTVPIGDTGCSDQLGPHPAPMARPL